MNTKRDGNIPPLVASPKAVGRMIDSGLTHVYELINSGEIQSYRDGKARKIIIASVEEYIARQLGKELGKEQRGWTDRATQARIKKRKLVAQPQQPPQTSAVRASKPNAPDKGPSEGFSSPHGSKSLLKQLEREQ